LQRWGCDEIERHFDYHPATNRMVARHWGLIVLWDLSTGLAVRHFALPGDLVAVAFTADGKSILAAANELRVFDVSSGAVKCKIPAPQSYVQGAAISADQRRLFLVERWHAAAVRSFPEGKLLAQFREDESTVARLETDRLRGIVDATKTTASLHRVLYLAR
jgi:hypothetical protein